MRARALLVQPAEPRAKAVESMHLDAGDLLFRPCSLDAQRGHGHVVAPRCELGGEKLRAQAAKFGFGDSLQVPMRVATSSVPAELNAPQSAQAAIGQYDVRTTPLQMAMVASAIANGGVEMRPRLVSQIRDARGQVVQSFQPEVYGKPISPDTAAALFRISSARFSNSRLSCS